MTVCMHCIHKLYSLYCLECLSLMCWPFRLALLTHSHTWTHSLFQALSIPRIASIVSFKRHSFKNVHKSFTSGFSNSHARFTKYMQTSCQKHNIHYLPAIILLLPNLVMTMAYIFIACHSPGRR